MTKASAGASEHLPIAKVTNIARTLEELKDKNLWIMGLDQRGTADLRRARLQHGLRHRARVRGKGVHDLVAKKCDFLVSIPMSEDAIAQVIFVAAGVMLYGSCARRKTRLRMQNADEVALASSASCVDVLVTGAALDREAFTFTHTTWNMPH